MKVHCFCSQCQAAARRRQWRAIALGAGVALAGLTFILITT